MSREYENAFYCEHCGHTLKFHKGVTERVCNFCGRKTKNTLNVGEQTKITYIKMKQLRAKKKMSVEKTPEIKNKISNELIYELVREYPHFKLYDVYKILFNQKKFLYKTTQLKVTNINFEKELERKTWHWNTKIKKEGI